MLNLTKVCCGYETEDVCKNIDLHFNKSQFTSIIGPNGAGKTTLLKAIAGILNYKGIISLDEENLMSLKRVELGQKFSLLSQTSQAYFNYSIYETAMLGRYPYLKGMLGIPSKQDKAIVKDALMKVGLLEQKDKSINELSGGQLQRVFLARTIAQQPQVILLDEPTNHLDFKHQIDILDFVKEWAVKENKIVVAVLHDLNLVHHFSDQIALLHEGRLYAKGTPKEVLTNANLQDVYGLDVKQWMKETLNLWT